MGQSASCCLPLLFLAAAPRMGEELPLWSAREREEDPATSSPSLDLVVGDEDHWEIQGGTMGGCVGRGQVWGWARWVRDGVAMDGCGKGLGWGGNGWVSREGQSWD